MTTQYKLTRRRRARAEDHALRHLLSEPMQMFTRTDAACVHGRCSPLLALASLGPVLALPGHACPRALPVFACVGRSAACGWFWRACVHAVCVMCVCVVRVLVGWLCHRSLVVSCRWRCSSCLAYGTHADNFLLRAGRGDTAGHVHCRLHATLALVLRSPVRT